MWWYTQNFLAVETVTGCVVFTIPVITSVHLMWPLSTVYIVLTITLFVFHVVPGKVVLDNPQKRQATTNLDFGHPAPEPRSTFQALSPAAPGRLSSAFSFSGIKWELKTKTSGIKRRTNAGTMRVKTDTCQS